MVDSLTARASLRRYRLGFPWRSVSFRHLTDPQAFHAFAQLFPGS
jgi:hypothetical protein